MSKSVKKLLITSIINICMAFFGLVAVTFAWTSINKNVDGDGIEVTVSKGDIYFDYTVYQYSADNRTFTDEGDFNLNPYDLIIKSRNEHTGIIIKLDISGEFLTDNSAVVINFLCSDQQINTNSLSNVVKIKYGLFNINSTDPETVYITAESNFENEQAYTFKTNNNKVLQVSKTISNYSNYVNNNALSVYLLIDYDEDLAEALNTVTLADFETTIIFNSDIYELNIAEEN